MWHCSPWELTRRFFAALVVAPLRLALHRVRIQRLVVVMRAMAIVVMAVIPVPVPRVSRAVLQFVRDVVPRGITASRSRTFSRSQTSPKRIPPRFPFVLLILLFVVIVVFGFLFFDLLLVFRFVIVEEVVRVPTPAPIDSLVRQPQILVRFDVRRRLVGGLLRRIVLVVMVPGMHPRRLRQRQVMVLPVVVMVLMGLSAIDRIGTATAARRR